MILTALAAASAIASDDWKPHPKVVPDITGAKFEAEWGRLDSKLQDILVKTHAPGIAVAIVKDDRVYLKAFGYANVEKKIKMTPDTICMIASCSKAFTSTLAMMAVDEGKLSLSAPVRTYIPYFKMYDAEADAKMTVADLMAHDSGLPRTDLGWASEALSTSDLIRLLGDCKPTFRFGENAQYSNMLVGTAATVTEGVYGEPWGAALKKKIFDPLHMDSTTTAAPEHIDPKRMAVGYWIDPYSGHQRRDRYFDVPFMLGAGGIKSTARDLSTWLRFHLGQGTFEGKKLVSADVLAEAYKPHMGTDDVFSFGLGWVVDSRRGQTLIWHDGALAGFQSIVGFVPNRHLGVAVLTNAGGPGANYQAMNAIIDKFLGTIDKEWFKEYAKDSGLYIDPTHSHLLRIWKESAASLWAMSDQGHSTRLTRKGPRLFETTDPRNPMIRVEFKDDPSLRGDEKHPQVVATIDGQTATYRYRMAYDAGITADALMKQVVEAQGGRENLAKGLNVVGRYDGHLDQEGVDVIGLWVRSGDDLGQFEQFYWGHRYLGFSHSGVNPHSAGITSHNNRVFPWLGWGVVDQQIDAQLCQALNWRATFAKAEIIARQGLGDRDVYVVRKTPRRSGNQVVDFIDVDTHLVLRREQGNPPSVELFSDYRPVEGVLVPYRITQIDPGLHREDIVISQFEKGDRYPHWAFYPRPYDAPLTGRG